MYSWGSIINGTETGPKTHPVFGFDIWVQWIIVDEFEVISTVALLCFTFEELEPDNLLIIILTAASNHPETRYDKQLEDCFYQI